MPKRRGESVGNQEKLVGAPDLFVLFRIIVVRAVSCNSWIGFSFVKNLIHELHERLLGSGMFPDTLANLNYLFEVA